MISLTQAHQRISRLTPLQPRIFPLDQGLALICAQQLHAAVDCPTVDSSLKDGFAVHSTDIAAASEEQPVTLTVAGALAAGDAAEGLYVKPGTAVRIMTGAPVPAGATAVLASEFAREKGAEVLATVDAHEGRNILCRGSDIRQGQLVMKEGTLLRPAHLGLLAAAGLSDVSCYSLPKVAVAATGSELVWPGERVRHGKVAASNMVTAVAELRQLGINAAAVLLRDNLSHLQEQFQELVRQVDVLITCGGVLDGDKDLTMRAMEQIGMEKTFHRVRIGPGKGACMGRVGKTVVFNLPGGPPSNHVALTLLALPGVRRLMGFANPLPYKQKVFASGELSGQKNWTQLFYSRIESENGTLAAVPFHAVGRLASMAAADALLEIPEGCARIDKGALVEAWFLREKSF